MKTFVRNILCLLTLTIFSLQANAVPSPYQPKDEELINKKIIKLPAGKIPVGNSAGYAEAVTASGDISISNTGVMTIPDLTASGNRVLKLARASFDVAVDGAGTGTFGLGVYLPAKSLIFQSMLRIDTAFVSSTGATVAVFCEDAGNIYGTDDPTAYAVTAMLNGSQVGFDDISTVGSGIASQCELSVLVDGTDPTAFDAGKLTAFLLYGVHE
jgi:hypothetical protein